MKSILLSTRPKWCEKICHEIGRNENGKPIYEKPIEVRKTKPSIPTPFKVYIYETYDKKYDGIGICWGKGKCFEHGCKKVIGEFICDRVRELDYVYYWNNGYEIDTCLTYREVADYGKGKPLYGWHITDLKIYDTPKGLSEFCKVGAKSLEELATDDELCSYCYRTGGGEYSMIVTPNGLSACEGRFCEEAYEEYLEQEFALTRPPQSWCYIQE